MKVPKVLTNYQKNYSDSSFWCKAKKLGKNVLEPALLLFYVMKSPDTPRSVKLEIAGALGYLILPVDLIPDFLPGGFADDLGALMAVYKLCQDYITPDIKAQAQRKLDELLS